MDGFLKRKCNDLKEKKQISKNCEKYHYDYIKAGNDFEPKVQCVECAKKYCRIRY